MLRVEGGNESGVAELRQPLSTAPEVFSLHEIDISWKSDVRGLLRSCGVSILHSSHVSEPAQAAAVHRLVLSGDDAQVGLLAGAMEPVDLDSPMRESVLRRTRTHPLHTPTTHALAHTHQSRTHSRTRTHPCGMHHASCELIDELAPGSSRRAHTHQSRTH